MPKDRVRAFVTALAFLLVLTMAVGSASASLDTTLAILAWGACLVGSIIIIVKSVRHGQTQVYGQLGALPRSWQRWILDEHEGRRADERPDPDHQHGS